ncbi:YciI family protein [Nonomuraea basaltis]|uniref:YciI family protein n=1 Tax=Nonomuraea basaltis TaxID=2495887 RepID=UPI00110C53DC|nr:YciI family protein [Nonomuraea basaltis]TMR93018.1 YciI family protein [Nonomuraea basaltis]
MKYLLMIHVNPAALEALSEEERNAMFAAHDSLTALTKESGELVGFAALADPANTTTVRVRDGVPAVTDGPYIEAKVFLAGYYVVDCETTERAAALAGMIPDARYTAVEVRPVMHAGGTEM